MPVEVYVSYTIYWTAIALLVVLVVRRKPSRR